MKIDAIITDFDGTLVDTFDANFRAYSEVFRLYANEIGIELNRQQYRECFGLRFEAFMDKMGIDNRALRQKIKEEKARMYPRYFDSLKPNKMLIDLIRYAKKTGVKVAIASTARRENLLNALHYLGLTDLFDIVFTGESVRKGKPDPEIYVSVMDQLQVCPESVLVFEDSDVGLQSAEKSGANYMKITNVFFE